MKDKKELAEAIIVARHFKNQNIQLKIIAEELNLLGFRYINNRMYNDKDVSNIIRNAAYHVKDLDPNTREYYKKGIVKVDNELIKLRVTCKGDYVAFCTTSRKPLMRAEKMKDIDLFIKAKKQAI